MTDLPIVVGVDGSEPSLRAVDWAADEAALRAVPLRLVYASLWDRYEGALTAQELDRPVEEVMAQDVVGTARERAERRRPGAKVTTAVRPEEPEYALVRESRTALAVVLGCRGRSGIAEALLGSVSVTVAGHAHCPVIVLRGSYDNQARSGTRGRVALGVGEKPAGSAAVRFATEEAVLRGVPLEAVRAWRRPAHATTGHPPPDFVRGYPRLAGEPAHLYERQAGEAVEEALRDAPAGLDVRRAAVEGHARDVLIAASYEADLLVVGARRRPGHFGLQLGRVAHGVLHHAACPVAVVPELP
ncbi:universal stress protein [Streptomyces alanosinicus]|uniref:Universal stress protein n=1 Tax=Streptomyces alanosinicus TaxID=68171 RepID=A0A918YR64_9ACTN|nr:universal stress protein [Streptomyces alanosinicus]GHE13550.1 universal stress protein [Streptomyces alanosinicus]